MENNIHGHDVMHMMVESDIAYTRDSLRVAIEQKFGESTRFFTCSAENMTADELITFLEARGKFQLIEGGFTTDPEKICNH
ncbi:MAG TPA: hypothetical protein DHU63_10335 [Candidatus Marinimicrobia bacterium]|nr:MAG: hypothetical protein AUJ47_01820 [Candidatus Marinimicrobia bacterium CG1_02_48_14]PJA53974.1 MAG: hypothetical protein CO167_06345 [Candidatus Marinimicrobia bacterium CG_4_9_14_3_um_filter_48_9]HCW76919.1 hypothetical protein [Candidatus Neomarinimicrobiota bacterium]